MRPAPASPRSALPPRPARPGRVRAAVATALVAVTALAGCGSTSSGVTAGRSDDNGVAPAVSTDGTGPDGSTPVDSTSPATPTTVALAPANNDPPPDGGIIDFGTDKEPKEYDNFMNRAFMDITAYWTEQYPALYGDAFTPIGSIYAVYPDRQPPAQCDGDVPYDYVEGNAKYVRCETTPDVILYDDAELVPQMVEQFGAIAVAVVAAHEYGHAIGAHAGVFAIPGLRTIDLEQQADCFAGAWVGHVARGESDLLQFTDQDVKSSIAAMIWLRDPVGINSAEDESGHGSAFDRVGAFQDGFSEGAQRCADYPDNPNPRVDLSFQPGTLEEQQGGNMPYPDITAALPKALDTFWVPTLTANGVDFTAPTMTSYPHTGPYPDCDGRSPEQIMIDPAVYCAGTNTIAYDADYSRALYDTFGDLAFGYPIASAYSDAVQQALGFRLEGDQRVLLDDCLVGAWIRDIIPASINPDGTVVATNPDQEILLSAGDLDEVVSTAVLEGDPSSTTNARGTAFEKIRSFRSGVQGGLGACQTLVDNGFADTTG